MVKVYEVQCGQVVVFASENRYEAEDKADYLNACYSSDEYHITEVEKESLIFAEWVPYMEAYRLYCPEAQYCTVAYDDSAPEALEQRIHEEGYDRLVFVG